MKGITFGELHSYRDLNLILSKKVMGAPTVKSKTIDIDGADSSLDLTDYFGEPKYENVTHKFEFSTLAPAEEFSALFSAIKNALHGKKMRVILDDDPLYYWLGRVYVSSFTNERNVGIVSVEADCEPYKLRLAETVVTKAVNGTTNISLTNSRKRAVPTITTTAAMTLTFGDFSTNRSAGTFIIPEFELVEGANNVTVTGTGNITFTWREGAL